MRLTMRQSQGLECGLCGINLSGEYRKQLMQQAALFGHCGLCPKCNTPLPDGIKLSDLEAKMKKEEQA